MIICTDHSFSKRILGAVPHALHAKDAFRSVLAFPRIVRYVHVHGAYLFAFPAGDAFVLIAFDPQQGEVAHGLQEHRNGAYVFAESAVILECVGKRDACYVVGGVSADECPEHDPFDVADPGKEQCRNEHQGDRESDVSYPSDLLSGGGRDFVGEEIQDHGSPAGISAPASAEQQRAEDLRNGVMNGRRLKHPGEQIVPESLDLHVLVADEPQIYQHVEADKELHYAPRMLVFPDEQESAQRNGRPDIAEIEQIKDIVLCQPQCDRNSLKDRKHKDRRKVFPHQSVIPPLVLSFYICSLNLFNSKVSLFVLVC